MKRESYEQQCEKEREEDYDQSEPTFYSDRKAVCKRCKYAMMDWEPMHNGGEFFHPVQDRKGKDIDCKNAGETFCIGDNEIEPFVKKKLQRLDNRNTKKFAKHYSK